MKVSDYIALRLKNEGVEYVFGVPGGPSVPYLEAFRRSGIEFFLTSDERSAGIMASVYSRLTGRPGVCHATFGPGAANLVSGTGCALLDRSPVIALTSEMSDEWIDRITQMNIYHQKLFSAVTKATFRINPDNAEEVLSRALSICRNEYPGPVHVGLPSDIAGMKIRKIRKTKTATVDRGEEITPVDRIGIINSLIDGSKAPVIAAGLTSARYNLSHELESLLKKFRAPVVLTPMAKGLLNENHPCYAGVLFHSLSGNLKEIFSKTDLVIGLGYDPVEYNYESWLPDVPLIHFDTVPSDLPANNNLFEFTGPPVKWFDILGKFSKTSEIITASILQVVREKTERMFDRFRTGFGCVEMLKKVRETFPPEAIITADVGSHLHIIGQYWKTFGYRNLLMTNGWSSMGFAIPAGIAAALVKPSSRVVTITGDGGFLMSSGEIITARRNRLKLIIIVLSDGELNLIKLKQQWKGLPEYGVKLYTGDLFGSDRYLGARVYTVTSGEKLQDALECAIRSNDVSIINAVINPGDYGLLIEKQY